MLAAWGRFVHRRRWAVLLCSLLLLAASLAGLVAGGVPVRHSASLDVEAQRAADLVQAELPSRSTGGSSFEVVFGSSTLSVGDPVFFASLEEAMIPVGADTRVTQVTTPYSAPPDLAPTLVSRDGHEALVVVSVRDTADRAIAYYPALRAEVRSDVLTVRATGELAVYQAFDDTLQADLHRAEAISLPIALLLLLLIFGSAVAAALPLAVGVLTIVGGLGATLLLARFTDVSQYALNIVTLIGLAISIDYSLFLVTRFREEVRRSVTAEEALAATMATAGKAITISGLTVAVGLSAMLLYQGTFLASIGVAASLSVAVAIVYALTLLPALLAVLGHRVDRLRVPTVERPRAGGFWQAMAVAVMRRPWAFLVPALALLAVAGLPFLHLRLAGGDVDQLPRGLEARDAYDALAVGFPARQATVLTVVVDYPGQAGTPANLGAVDRLSSRVAALPDVVLVQKPAAGGHVVVLDVATNQPFGSDAARRLLTRLRAQRVPGARVLVTGDTAYDVDQIGFIVGRTPLVVGLALGATLVLLLLATGSVVVPAKAVVTNVASLSASFGALVWIFQDGHLGKVLGFTPQSIDPTIPVLLFCALFGISMDYEVLLISRMRELFLVTQNNRYAVARGLEHTARWITGAAAIMVVVFLAFGLAQVLYIKEIGLGLAIAIFMDATVIRAVLVPAAMRLLGAANWWGPFTGRRRGGTRPAW
jgi:uncharacterized membrane protein YdfJ with MMPL/SSD domain